MRISKYYQEYKEHKLPHTLGPFDQEGIPMFDPAQLNLKGSVSYHPIVIVQYALAHYNLWCDSDSDENKKEFLNCAVWLKDNCVQKGEELAFYYYDFDLKNPPIPAPWYSGMAQGQILSLFARAYAVTEDDAYLKRGEQILNTFRTTIDEGGCGSFLGGQLFIQEVAAKPELYILNGAVYAIIGIIEFSRITQENLEMAPFLDGLEVLLPRFNLGLWTRYSLGMRFNLATKYYQKVHGDQLIYLSELTGRSSYLKYGEKFLKQFNRNKSWFGVVLFFSLNINRAFRVFGLRNFLYKY